MKLSAWINIKPVINKMKIRFCVYYNGMQLSCKQAQMNSLTE